MLIIYGDKYRLKASVHKAILHGAYYRGAIA